MLRSTRSVGIKHVQPHSGLLSACQLAVSAVVKVALCAVLHARTHWNHAHTHAALPFLGCPELMTSGHACRIAQCMGAVLPSDTALAAGDREASVIATEVLSAAPMSSAESSCAGRLHVSSSGGGASSGR